MHLVKICPYMSSDGAGDRAGNKDGKKDRPVPDLRTPKGTLDYGPKEVLTQRKIINEIVEVFERHGGQPTETPTFELRSVLMNKYGEDTKLIYNIEDQGGDVCSLRYDLTVPFARYAAMRKVDRLKRYQIGRVYRRDNPSFLTGRLREFIQADFDIAGCGAPMLADAEVVSMVCDILRGFGKKFTVRINDRRIIAGMFQRCGVAAEHRAPACSTLDKMDKLSWEQLSKEFAEKGLKSDEIAMVKDYATKKGSNDEIISFLEKQVNPEEKDDFAAAIEDLKCLLRYVAILGAERIEIDLSLARGLDYYTGLIIEASFVGTALGSVIGGGRYDKLCASISRHSVPCVGFSVGVSRLCTLAEQVSVSRGVFVGSACKLLVEERLALLAELWGAGLAAETLPGCRVNFKDQLEHARKNGFWAAVFTGENEIENGTVTVFDLASDARRDVQRTGLVEYLVARRGSSPSASKSHLV